MTSQEPPPESNDEATDDRIASWVAEANAASHVDSEQGRSNADSESACEGIDPAWAPRKPIDLSLTVVGSAACPDCGCEITLTEADRGKTHLCPSCKNFIGCLLPVESVRARRGGTRGRRGSAG